MNISIESGTYVWIIDKTMNIDKLSILWILGVGIKMCIEHFSSFIIWKIAPSLETFLYDCINYWVYLYIIYCGYNKFK